MQAMINITKIKERERGIDGGMDVTLAHLGSTVLETPRAEITHLPAAS